jgi:CBS domain-containing protein
MDGGRVLRSLLATRLGRRRATAIAANVGQGMAILFGIVGFLYNPFLIFIAIFVYLGAQAEAGMTEMQSAMEGLRVRDAMMTRFRTLSPHDHLNKAVEELLAGSQQDFPVLENSAPVGILRRNDLVKALSEGRREATVGEVMCRQCETVDELSPLKQAVESMHSRQCVSVPVSRGRAVVGLLTLENISEMIMINAALGSDGVAESRKHSTNERTTTPYGKEYLEPANASPRGYRQTETQTGPGGAQSRA